MIICFNCGKKLTKKKMKIFNGEFEIFKFGKKIECGGQRPVCDNCLKSLKGIENG